MRTVYLILFIISVENPLFFSFILLTIVGAIIIIFSYYFILLLESY